MKKKILSVVVMMLMIAGMAIPVLGETVNIGNAGQKEQPSVIGGNVSLDVAITTDYVNGWQDHGLRIREYALNGTVWAYSEISAPDLYGLYFTQKWWYDNGTGLEFKWTYSYTITDHWTSAAIWTWWQIGLDYDKGQGFIETDVNNVSLGISNWYAIGNTKPNTPTITGNVSGKIKKPYSYTFNATDPDGFNLSYFVDWGDNTTTDWTTFTSSGASIQLTHTWTKKGDYIIKCKVKDRAENQSAWGTLSVTMPCSYNIPLQLFWQKLFERFQHSFPIMRYIWGTKNPHLFLLFCHLIRIKTMSLKTILMIFTGKFVFTSWREDNFYYFTGGKRARDEKCF
jgi:hypothetical protein